MRTRLKPIALWAAMFAVLLAIGACQTAPVQEMSDARQAISVAREAGAADYAADDLNAAIRYLESAEQFLGQRRYAEARREATQAKLKALEALERSDKDADDIR